MDKGTSEQSNNKFEHRLSVNNPKTFVCIKDLQSIKYELMMNLIVNVLMI